MATKKQIEELSSLYKELKDLSNKYNELAKEYAFHSRIGIASVDVNDELVSKLYNEAASKGIPEDKVDEYVEGRLKEIDVMEYIYDRYDPVYVDIDSSDDAWFPSGLNC